MENLRNIGVESSSGEFKVSINYDHTQQEFTPTNRALVLYSRIKYSCENFDWDAVIPTVRIPYKDPALGFLVDGVIFSSVGIYQRAPGVVVSGSKAEPKVDIVTIHNSTISIECKRNGLQIVFKRAGHEKRIPMGIFLKAISGLPYNVILDGFAYKPQTLLYAFPCEVPSRSIDLSKVPTYGIDGEESEPTIDDCIEAVYTAIMNSPGALKPTKPATTNYSVHWKATRIQAYFDSLKFKTVQNYEANLSIGNRAVGTYLSRELNLPIFAEDGTVTAYTLPKGHFLTDDDAREIRRHDIATLAVKAKRNYILQEDAPMLFRAKGYKLAVDVPEAGLHVGDYINDSVLAKLNATRRYYIEAFTPTTRKVIHRSDNSVGISDFYTIINYFYTKGFIEADDSTQYEVSNRVIVGYEQQVAIEVEQTYSEIIAAISGSSTLLNLLDSIPKLPTVRLAQYLRDAKHKEVAQSDLTNIMSRAIAEGKASALMRSTPKSMSLLQRGQYGRMDSLHSPESDKIGSVQQLTVSARINSSTGEIEAPYEKVTDGVPTGEIVYITAAKENNKYIVAWNNNLTEPTVMARYNGDVTTVSSERVDYRDPSPFCDMSVSRATIPFPEFSYPRRSQMATKMNAQAVPLLFPERALVCTGADTEVPCLYYTTRDILASSKIAEVPGEFLDVVGVNWGINFATYSMIYGVSSFVFAVPFSVTDKKTLYHYNLKIQPNYKYAIDDLVFYNQSCDIREYDFWTKMEQGSMPFVKDYKKPAMALGVNLRVCYKTLGASTIEDPVVISDRLVKNNKLSSIQLIQYKYELRREEYFDLYDGVVKVHRYVHEGESLVKVIKPKNGGTVVKNVRAKQAGEVVFAEIDANEHVATVLISTLHYAKIGDKVAGRCGNKSIIARILPEEDMPYDPETGESCDIICSELGIPSRMNLGQLLEVMLGQAMRVENKVAVVTPFFPNIKEDIAAECDRLGIAPRKLYNPIYGKMTECRVLMGVMYFLKLEQISNLKFSAVGYPTSIDPVFGQPVESLNHDKGQTIGEMESWALAAAGAKNMLNNMYTMCADNEKARRQFFDTLEGNRDGEDAVWDESQEGIKMNTTLNNSSLVTQVVYRSFGLELYADGDSYKVEPLDLSNIQNEITLLQLKNHTDRVGELEWSRVKLNAPIINPFWINNFPLHIMLGVKSVSMLAKGKHYLNVATGAIFSESELTPDERAQMITGISAVIALLRNTDIDSAIARLIASASDKDEIVTEVVVLEDVKDTPNEVQDELLGVENISLQVSDIIKFLQKIKQTGQTLEVFIWDYIPIIPKVFRQTNLVNGTEHIHSFQKQLVSLVDSSRSQDIYDSFCTYLGYGSSTSSDLVSIRGYFFGKDLQAGQHGKVRSSVLSKRVGFAGRAVIAPMDDMTMSPFFIGIPWKLFLIQACDLLTIRLRKRQDSLSRELQLSIGLPLGCIESLDTKAWARIIESLYEFNAYTLGQYFPELNKEQLFVIYSKLREVIRTIVEQNTRDDGFVRYKGEWVDPTELPDDADIDTFIASAGRQPTLHKKSIRTFYIRLVDGYCIRLNTLVCSAYNADYDGDTMHEELQFGLAKLEGCKKTSILQDLISEKDGSFTLSLTQDAALGLYCATIFKDNTATFKGNKGEVYYFSNQAELQLAIEYGDVHYYDAVVFTNEENGKSYISTAGRVLANLAVPGALTQVPFTDEHGICAQVLGSEYIGNFCAMHYDDVWSVTYLRPEGRPNAVQVNKFLVDVYNTYGARESVMTAQRLFELGLTASDIYSVSFSFDDLKTDVDLQKYMEEPEEYVNKLNGLYQLGLITDTARKVGAAKNWDNVKKQAQKEIIAVMNPQSNLYYMLYSGARGKPDQVMQAIGFIGTISKTSTVDIEYPILRSYGSGLSSLDLYQTCPSARMGVTSTQAGTKDTGYATRQSVYMTSGLEIVEDDCGINNLTTTVKYDTASCKVVMPDGNYASPEALLGMFVLDSTQGFDILRIALTRNGYMINEQILELILDNGITSVSCVTGTVEIKRSLDEDWKQQMISSMYSYALPYTDDRKITEESLNWVEQMELREIIAYDEDLHSTDDCFNREAFLPVEYDEMKYTIYCDGTSVDEDTLYSKEVAVTSEKCKYYAALLSPERCLTVRAVNYLTHKGIQHITFTDGAEFTVKYKLTSLFSGIALGRQSCALPYLDRDGAITEQTLQEVEALHLEYIPVRTTLTCLSESGVCSKCYGKSLTSKQFLPIKANLGIACSQAMCEPLSQATLNVTHSGGRRDSGVGLVSGLSYYFQLLKGKLITERTAHLAEVCATTEGYYIPPPHVKQIGKPSEACDGWDDKVIRASTNVDRPMIPYGVFVDEGDIVVNGLADLSKYRSTDVFTSARKTRYLLMEEYSKIFSALDVSTRNYEILARAQTSNCYLKGPKNLPKIKDTGAESKTPTGYYELIPSPQAEVVKKFSGVADYAFENVLNMLLSNLLTPEGLPLNSVLGNLVTGTEVGSTKPVFIPREGAGIIGLRKPSALRNTRDALVQDKRESISSVLSITDTFSEHSYELGAEVSLLEKLLGSNAALNEHVEHDAEQPAITNKLSNMNLGGSLQNEDTQSERLSRLLLNSEFVTTEETTKVEQKTQAIHVTPVEVIEADYIEIEESVPEESAPEEPAPKNTSSKKKKADAGLKKLSF